MALPLQRAQPLVDASGQPSPALPTSTPTEYTFLRTMRRHRSLRDKVGSQFRKLLARAKSITVPPKPPKAREYEDVQPIREPQVHRRTVSDTSQLVSVRRTHSDELVLMKPPRPASVVQTRSFGSNSTPRVEEEDEPLNESPTVYKFDYANQPPTSPKPKLILTTSHTLDSSPYIPPDNQASTSLFEDPGSSSGTCEQTPKSGNGTLAEDEIPHEPTDGPSTQYVNPTAPLHAMLDPVDANIEPKVPAVLVQGTPLLKISPKKTRQKFFRLDADQGLVTWQSEKAGLIYIENIKEIRVGEQARYYREQFKIAAEREERWMTISYTSDNKYKLLHVVAYSRDIALLWQRTLLSLRALRQSVMSGLVSPARMWEKHYWRGADMSKDEKLEIEEVVRLCRRLNVAIEHRDLAERFKSADKGSKGYLDFSDFQNFVKTLQARPETKRLWKRLRGEGLFDLEVFTSFLKNEQECHLPAEQVERMFIKYATGGVPVPEPEPTRPLSPVRSNTSPPGSRPSSPNPAIRRSTSLRGKARSRSRSRSRSALGKLIPGVGAKVTHTPAGPGSPTICSYPDRSDNPTIAAGLVPTTLLATPPPLHFTLDDFNAFLLSADNAAFGDKPHDMTHPLSDYYISSSHNTYLVGHQLVGESTIEGYIRALSAGCRSVEVDIWDGDYEPVITHGRTLTGSVPLKHVAQAIAKYAFVASPYPVIISAEMHAGIEQQSMVAAIFKEAFGEALVTAPLDGSIEELEALPSPEALKNRVLVKFKNAFLSEVEVEVEGEDDAFEDTATSDSESAKELGRALSLAKRVRKSFRASKRPDMSELSPPMSPSNTLMLDPLAAYTPTTPTVTIPTSPPRKKQRAYSNRSEFAERPKLKMSRSLADLLIYTVGVKFRGLNKKERYGVEQMFSLSEKTANKLLKENALGLAKHCRTNLVRLYPNGTRVNSTNYEPCRYWAAGVQLVALNWQTIDLGNMMNQSMFHRNNRAGYLLKPSALRTKDKEALTRRTEYVLEITVISAQQIPRRRDENGREIIKDSIMDPLVEVSLHVPDWPTAPVQDRAASDKPKVDKREAKSDKRGESRTEKRTVRTTAVKNNGFNPVWEETVTIPFTCVGDMWDLIFVRFAVLDDDEDDDPLAVHCVSLDSLRRGYRHLPLHDLQFSQYLFSTLFVHVSVRPA